MLHSDPFDNVRLSLAAYDDGEFYWWQGRAAQLYPLPWNFKGCVLDPRREGEKTTLADHCWILVREALAPYWPRDGGRIRFYARVQPYRHRKGYNAYSLGNVVRIERLP